MSYADHDHRGDYADQRHDHDGDYAALHHRHYDDESTARGLREDLAAAEEHIRELADDLRGALDRIRELEGQTPQAQRLQLEADQAAADLAGAGYDRHGRDCQCSYCATDDDPPVPADDPPVPADPAPYDYQSEEVAEAFTEWCAARGIEPRDDQEYRWLRQAFTAGMNEVTRYGVAGVTP